MSSSPAPNREYCEDLLIQQAVYGLSPSQKKEIDLLSRQFDLDEDDRFDGVIGALDAGLVAQAEDAHPEFPSELRARILNEATRVIGAQPDTEQTYVGESAALTSPRSRSSAWTTREKFLGLVTVASLLMALLTLSGMFGPIGKELPEADSVAERMQLLLNSAADVKRMPWTNPTNDPASTETTGEVVWSDLRQEGYMVFDRFTVNDATEQQYQLWIFDTTRDDVLPVDGGVFDVTSRGELIVPIDAKLNITDAKAFAVTIEIPGGVVKSERTRLPLLAGNL